MREVELKGVVTDPERALRALEAAGAQLEFRGRLGTGATTPPTARSRCATMC
jgi:hypothetical protein